MSLNITGPDVKLWTEMRTAMTVAQLGSVRAASTALGIHRATVTRHIDALEADLGIRLFLRHAEGYAVTADGEALKRLADSTDRLVESFMAEATISPDDLSGSLTISLLASNAPLVMPAIDAFCRDHPNVQINLLAESGLSRLELGQADIALRTGPKPDNPDYVVVPFQREPVGLFGHRRYFDGAELPRSVEDLTMHRLIGTRSAGGTIDVCARFDVPKEALTLVTNDPSIALRAVEAGMGLGILYGSDGSLGAPLIEVLVQSERRTSDVWIVTHVDLHRTTLLQTVLQYLRA
ncbi:MAG: LysR family transcriptional regulator [Pseudomonadota bacterium]